MKLTFLGTGTSFGVPQIACPCPVCHSSDPRDRRTRVGAVVESDRGSRVLIDMPPELRLQLVAAGIGRVEAVLLTHDHADHTQGIDDIRALSLILQGPLSIYGPAEAMDALSRRFPYIFDPRILPLPGTTKPEARAHALTAYVSTRVADLDVLPLPVPHGPIRVFGYRIGSLGYITDAKAIPAEAVEQLRGVKVLVLNALFRVPHPTHLSIDEAIAAARAVGAERTYLTHLTHDNFHAALAAELPEGISPAYDGLTVEVG